MLKKSIKKVVVMQSQGLEFDSMMDEDIFKTIQEEIEKEKNGSKLMNHYDLSLKGKFLEEAGNLIFLFQQFQKL